ncbi:MAG: Mut7-C RNAse domain-containing protein [Phycisphaerae bacterium]|nr:Mut7-C RNAse domain-containing protein [Phycisphaerae bacterium]
MNDTPVRVTCDACCGGLARWLRLLGIDTTYEAGIDDGVLVRQALDERRVVVSCDSRLFERRLFTTGKLRGILLPVGLDIAAQLDRVVPVLAVTPAFPRCTRCNGRLESVGRSEVADVVPARTLAWIDEYYRCGACGHVFWEGTHWRRIHAVRARLGGQTR